MSRLLGRSQDQSFESFWRQTTDALDRYVEVLRFLDSWATDIASDPAPGINWPTIVQFVTAARDFQSNPDGGAVQESDRKGQVVDDNKERFRRACQELRIEILSRISELGIEEPANGDRDVGLLLSGDLDAVAQYCGSLSRAWDSLVKLKRLLSVPERTSMQVSAWWIAAASECERFLRHLIIGALTEVGRLLDDDHSWLREASMLANVAGSREALLQYHTTDEVLVQGILGYMRRGSSETVEIADGLARLDGLILFPDRNSMRFQVSRLGWIGGSQKDIWERIFLVRRELIHRSPGMRRGGAVQGIELGRLNSDNLVDIAEFLFAVGVAYCLHLLNTVVHKTAKVAPQDEPAKPVEAIVPIYLKHKLAGELRFIVMSLLEESRWLAAWALSEVAMSVEPLEGTMLRLNTLFARQKLVPSADITREIRECGGETVAPRYELIKRSLLSHFEGVGDTLDRVFEGDMSLKELQEWPILESLRQSKQYREWYEAHVAP